MFFENMTVLLLLFGRAFSLDQPPALSAQDIISRSAQAIHEDWERAPNFDFCELDEHVKTTKTYQVIMISGSPYNRLVAMNGNALSPEMQSAEAEKLAAAILQRQKETAEAHQQRIAQYEKERQRDQQLLEELTRAMEFTFTGYETVDAHETYVLDAKPKHGYVPRSVVTRVLTGMQGRLWIDRASYRWVKVKAEVVHPVTIEGFVARVEPGTQFELEETPVEDPSAIWLASHFKMQSRAKIFWLFPKSSMEDETYFHYKVNGALSAETCEHP